MESSLNNNILNRRFEFEIKGQNLFVEYQEHLNVISLIYTHIPDKLIGKGAFGLLAESIFNYAKTAKVKLIVVDRLFKNYVFSHPEHHEVLNDPVSEATASGLVLLPDA